MPALKMRVFDVQRGLCVFLRTPTDHGIMIDCGRSDDRSPAAWVLANEAPTLQRLNGYTLAYLIVTHPHDDHVEDIDNIKTFLPPAILGWEKNHDWATVLNPPNGEPSENVVTYREWQETYNQPIAQMPDFGITLTRYWLLPTEAATVSSATQNLVNNTSMVTVVDYATAGGVFKVVIAGDNETAGWEALLKKSDFKKAVAGAHFFVTAHHGHESGYSNDLLTAMGTPLVNITSERAGDECVHDYGQHAKGAMVGGESRSHLTTRCDGDITISMNSDWNYTITTTR